ncbi:peptidyl-tRNA hydrolase domain protein (macronuclear) [Tetrahymena thermophila SB210]|uniref:Peptidyl-tRNA hydrolase domain protein n=1 Tax=Tetrahymena thermophila (strain SB210) TaxID=312017 RepID=Q22CY3_TETTS|nr:peptidyl-tRNA hydrolase domain protein [Tetrahymena thermophila SB210]EAR83136.2 peptidyl-tRNA hydrolase domain protein [Tetrahymena thermophila SB210]|eukprot:XP_001030799.2 peptidyl-tRNA hydrolase domain protein [Tetrahymena thermophila SB210]
MFDHINHKYIKSLNELLKNTLNYKQYIDGEVLQAIQIRIIHFFFQYVKILKKELRQQISLKILKICQMIEEKFQKQKGAGRQLGQKNQISKEFNQNLKSYKKKGRKKKHFAQSKITDSSQPPSLQSTRRVIRKMIACLSNEKNELSSSTIEDSIVNQSLKQFEDKKNSNESAPKTSQNSPKLVAQVQQKHQEKRTFPYFRYDDTKRLNSLKNIINQAQKGKPIRLYLENVPNFANEFDFEERCRGLLNVVWNHKKQNSCFILMENKDYALDVLDLEKELPPYCKEGRIFVTRVEENSILYAKKPNPKRFETYYNLSDDTGFFIVENDKMKYFWYDQNGGFYDEYGIYYNQKGRPSPPPYLQSKAGRSKKNNNRGNYEKNNKNQNYEQKGNSPALNGLKQQSLNQVEYIKKSDLESIEAKARNKDLDFSSNNSNKYNKIGNNENSLTLQQSASESKLYPNYNNQNRPKSNSGGSFNNKGKKQGSFNQNNSNYNNQRNAQRNKSDTQFKNNENEKWGNSNYFNGMEKSDSANNLPQKQNNFFVNNNNNNNNQGGFKNRQKSNSQQSPQ